MRRVAQIAILALVALVGARPLMACMLPSAVMTAQEKACCRRMAHSCGDHSMPSSHSCCKTIESPDQVAVAKASFSFAPQFDLVYQVQPAVVFGYPAVQATGPSLSFVHPPPESPPPSFDILRI